MNKITLQDYLSCINYEITGSEKYQGACFGPHAFYLDYWNGRHMSDHVAANVVFDAVTQTVYEVEVWDGKNQREYRWIHPDYIIAVKNECAMKGRPFEESVPGSKYIDLDLAHDMLEKISAIHSGEDYDPRVAVEIDLTKDEQFELMKLAHEADITLNEYVKRLLEKALEKDNDN